MSFLGVGPAELLVIMVIALLVVGPERLPRLAADIARTIREIRAYTASVAGEFNQVLQDLEKEAEPERAEWKEIGEGLSGAGASFGEALQGAADDAAAAVPPPSGNGAAPAGTPAQEERP
jgi:sec-independent protein translocase protein TatB